MAWRVGPYPARMAALLAWCELLGTTGGLPPLPAGVTALPTRRAQQPR